LKEIGNKGFANCNHRNKLLFAKISKLSYDFCHVKRSRRCAAAVKFKKTKVQGKNKVQ